MEDRGRKLLKAYAENNMSMKKTSGAVYLHYNSIRYRFRLIQRETGMDAQGSLFFLLQYRSMPQGYGRHDNNYVLQ